MTFGAIPVCILVTDREGVIERCTAPGIGVMAVGTLTLEVVGRPCMARLAICQPTVIEIHVLEITRILVAACTGSGEMIPRRVVAGRTILPANVGMTEIGVVEIARILVASRTCPGKMALWRAVAGRTILPANIGVAERRISEIVGVVVAAAASACVMALRRVVTG